MSTSGTTSRPHGTGSASSSGTWSTVTQNIWRRNLALWSDVSHHLRADSYTADEMAADAARALAVSLDNATDIWSALVRLPERERTGLGSCDRVPLLREERKGLYHPHPARSGGAPGALRRRR